MGTVQCARQVGGRVAAYFRRGVGVGTEECAEGTRGIMENSHEPSYRRWRG